jgi:hypothetical protein
MIEFKFTMRSSRGDMSCKEGNFVGYHAKKGISGLYLGVPSEAAGGRSCKEEHKLTLALKTLAALLALKLSLACP